MSDLRELCKKLNLDFWHQFDPSVIKSEIQSGDLQLLGAGRYFEVYGSITRNQSVAMVYKKASREWPILKNTILFQQYMDVLATLNRKATPLVPPVASILVGENQWLVMPKCDLLQTKGWEAEISLAKTYLVDHLGSIGWNWLERFQIGMYKTTPIIYDLSDLLPRKL